MRLPRLSGPATAVVAGGVLVAVTVGFGIPVLSEHSPVTTPLVDTTPVMTTPPQPPPTTDPPAPTPPAPVTVAPATITAMVRGRMMRCTLNPGPDDYLCEG